MPGSAVRLPVPARRRPYPDGSADGGIHDPGADAQRHITLPRVEHLPGGDEYGR